MGSEGRHWPLPEDAPAFADLSRCVHCGLCVTACPTYVVTGREAESPRGRLYLARAVSEGRIGLTEAVEAHWDLCLQCRACEAVCPSGVPYGRIMEHVRAQVAAAPAKGRFARRLRRLVLRNLVARPGVLAAAVAPVRWFAGSRTRRLAVKAGLLRLPSMVGRLEKQLPHAPGRPLRAGDALPEVEAASSRAVLFTGCVMGELFGNVHRATARVLARAGIQALAAPGQVCCGALSAHDGDLAFARGLARRNIEALELVGEDPIIVDAAGCGAALKEYEQLLAGDREYAVRARAFAARVRDASEFVAELPMKVPARLGARVTYQDPCHLAHAQRIREAPRRLLAGIDGCTLVETVASDLCCGAAGTYGLLQPAMSAALRARKAAAFHRVRPDAVATANPGCQMQYEAAVREAGLSARVVHVMELLDEAQARAGG
ncbi:MAG: 4Fe-4S dicluster domain-containing protein [Dehalococcoidia bacterium]|nr:4Fe-4S dicluster domain-containing protein [Dehalococcoidia bacterium]